jgi:lysophospholipase L1-like esterase
VRVEQPPNAAFIVQGDFQGRWFNVSQGRRRTTDQPAHPVSRVLLFGGSTVFCQEVPDDWTLASCLQRHLHDRFGPAFRVENLGAVSMTLGQHAARLEETKFAEGDVVIFYAGVNDAYYPVYNGNLRGWLPGDGHDGGVRTLGALERLLYPHLLRWRDSSALAALIFARWERPAPDHLSQRAILDSHLDAAQAAYRDGLLLAARDAAYRGARFVHFLQPNLYTLRNPSSYERRRQEHAEYELPGISKAFQLGYARFREAMAEARAAGVESFDVSDALDGRSAEDEVYLDYCHVNHEGNALVARRILECLVAAHGDEMARQAEPVRSLR